MGIMDKKFAVTYPIPVIMNDRTFLPVKGSMSIFVKCLTCYILPRFKS